MNLQLDLLEELAESLETLLEEIYDQEDLEEAEELEGVLPPPGASLLEKLRYLVQTQQLKHQQALQFLSLYLSSPRDGFHVPPHLHQLAQQLHLMALDEDRMRVQ